MTRPRGSELITSSQIPLNIAVDILLRCEHFFRSLAFQCGTDTPEERLKAIQKVCTGFHETLFIIDHTLYKYRTEHKLRHDNQDSSAYHLLSEINEQLTDYAFLIGHKIHPWDIPYAFEEPSSPSYPASRSISITKLPSSDSKLKYGEVIKYPPATWKNRELRQTTTPLAGFSLEKSGSDEKELD